jgi:hypothetical protein
MNSHETGQAAAKIPLLRVGEISCQASVNQMDRWVFYIGIQVKQMLNMLGLEYYEILETADEPFVQFDVKLPDGSLMVITLADQNEFTLIRGCAPSKDKLGLPGTQRLLSTRISIEHGFERDMRLISSWLIEVFNRAEAAAK